MMKDCIPITGRVRIRVRNPDGSVDKEMEGDNLVVVAGYSLFASLIAKESVDAINHMAAGDSNLNPDEDQTGLQGTEQARASTVLTRVDNELNYVADFAAVASNKKVSEFGLFNDEIAGTMAARFISSEFTVFTGQAMEVLWTIRVGR